jgi:SET domain-containing protein
MSIQLRKYKKVILGQSLIIPSNGLFAYENIKANDLIGVYLGEIVERTELDRRSVFSDELEKHYSFSQDDNFDIDALRCGNAMRYINHSKYGYENCFAKNVFTQGRIIVALYAKRDIMKGEELYFDYRMKNVHWINMYNKQYKP